MSHRSGTLSTSLGRYGRRVTGTTAGAAPAGADAPGPGAGHATEHPDDRPRLRGWIHRVALFTFPVAGIFVVLDAPTRAYRWPALVYVAGMTGVFFVSSSFHLGTWQGSRYTLMRRLDHSMNAVAIASGYTPFLAYCFSGTVRTALLVGYWSLTALAVASRVLWIHAPAKVVAASYLTLGWLGLLLLPFIAHRIAFSDLLLIFLAAVCFSVGAAIYAIERPDPWPRVFGFHEIFHALALAGQLILLFVVWRQFPA